jgi:hypothetical protein
MRRLTVVGGTLLAMVAAAGVGAFVAAHSTERDAPSVGPPTDASAGGNSHRQERWQGVMISRTSRGYRSGGTCATDWKATLRMQVDEHGAIDGSGTAKLTSGPACPFVTGQPQLHRFDLKLEGWTRGKQYQIRVIAEPDGSGIDYGGFDEAFEDGRTVSLATTAGAATAHSVARVVPADPTDTAIARTSIRLSPAKASA